MAAESAPEPKPVLVVGATGKTGRRVADRLAAASVSVRRAARSGPVRFDWHDDSTWAPALGGGQAMYLTFATPDLAAPGAAELVGRFTRLATDAGVQHLVLLSGRGEPGAQGLGRPPRTFADYAQRTAATGVWQVAA